MYSQLINGVVLSGSSARPGFRGSGVGAQASHDAHTLREDKPSVDAHSEGEENGSHVPYAIEEAIVLEDFITFCKLRKCIS